MTSGGAHHRRAVSSADAPNERAPAKYIRNRGFIFFQMIEDCRIISGKESPLPNSIFYCCKSPVL